jgi:GAF domain-containing protein
VPDLSALTEVIQTTDSWEQTGEPLPDLLKQLMPPLQRVLPGARLLHLYNVVDEETLVNIADGTHITFEGVPQATLSNNRPTHNTDGWWLPLHSDSYADALLHIEGAADADLQDWLTAAAAHLNGVYNRWMKLEIRERQSLTLSAMVAGQDVVGMAQIVARYMLPQPGRLLTISELIYDDHGRVVDWRMIASANRARGYATPFDENPATWQDAAAYVRNRWLDGDHLLFDDIQALDPQEIGAGFHQWLTTSKVRTHLSLPILRAERTVALLVIVSKRPADFSREEVEAFQDIAAQMGSVLYIRRLRSDTEAKQATIDDLTLANRLITTAADVNYMANAVMYTLGKAMIAAGITLFDRPLTPGQQPETHKLVGASAANTVIPIEERTSVNLPTENEILTLRRGLPLIIDGEAAAGRVPAQIYDVLETDAIMRLFIFGLRSGDELLGTLTIAAENTQDLDETETSAFSTLADQVGVVLRGRQLLDVTEQSLDEVQQLYDINRTLLTSHNSLDVLRALQAYFAETAQSLHLVSLQWDELTGQLISLKLEALIKEGEEREENYELLPNLSEEELENLKEEWAIQGKRIDVIEDLEATLEERPAGKHTYEAGGRSVIVMPIYDGDYMVQQITVVYEEPRQFDERTRRLLDAARDQIGIVLENQRLLRGTRETAARLGNQVRVLQTINHLAADLRASQDESTLLDETCEGLFNALDVDHVSIVTAGRIVSEYPARGLHQLRLEAHPLPQAQRHDLRQHVFVDDIDTRQGLNNGWQEMLTQAGAHALLAVPLLDTRGELIGMVNLLRDSAGAFTQYTLGVMRTITAQISVTLQNARLLRDTQRQAEQLERIAGFSEAIQGTLDTEVMLDIAVNSTSKILPTEHLSIAFYDNSRGVLRRVAWLDDAGETHVMLATGLPITDGRSNMCRVWESKIASKIDDLQAQAEVEHDIRTDLRSIITQPVLSRGTMRGVIEIGSTRPNAYSAVDNVVFQQVVSQLAVALQNAEAYTESQRLARSKALTNDISAQLQQQKSIEKILDVTTRELGKSLGAKRARIRLDPSVIDSQEQNGTG